MEYEELYSGDGKKHEHAASTFSAVSHLFSSGCSLVGDKKSLESSMIQSRTILDPFIAIKVRA